MNVTDAPEVRFTPDGQLMIVDCSIAKTFQNCHRKGQLKGLLQLSPRVKRMPLTFGHCMHEALYTWYETGDRGLAIRKWKEVTIASEIPFDGDKRSQVNGLFILDHYIKKYDEERQTETRLGGEMGFCLPIPGLEDTMIAGRLDYIFSKGDSLRIRDHKTASGIGESYRFNVRPNIAASIYTWAAETLIEQRVEMFDFDVILVAKEKREAIRFPVTRSQFDIDQALDDLRVVCRDIRAKVKSGEWEKNTDHCSQWGGCEYYDICTTADPRSIIDSMFCIEPWRPYVTD